MYKNMNLMQNLSDYLGYLSEQFFVSVHFEKSVMSRLPYEWLMLILRYNTHKNPRCAVVKSRGISKCMAEQSAIYGSEHTEPFVRVCHGGLEEYITPITENGRVCGFIAVSGECEGAKVLIPPLCMMLYGMLKECHRTPSEFNLIVDYLNDNHRDMTLDKLCLHFNRSRSHISHLFKSKCGMTVSGYCNRLKLADAKELLQNSDLSVTDIAYECGFNDVSYFIGLFKKRYGLSPLRYRRK